MKLTLDPTDLYWKMHHKFPPSKFYKPKGFDSNKNCYQVTPKKQKQKPHRVPTFSDFDYPHSGFIRRISTVRHYIDDLIISHFMIFAPCYFYPELAICG